MLVEALARTRYAADEPQGGRSGIRGGRSGGTQQGDMVATR